VVNTRVNGSKCMEMREDDSGMLENLRRFRRRRPFLILGQVDISSVFEKRQRMQGQLAILDGLDALEIADSTDQTPRR